MLKIWLVYNLLIIGAIFSTSLAGAKSIPQFLIPLLLLPLIYHLGSEVIKPTRRRKLSDPALYASNLTTQASQQLSNSDSTTILEGQALEPNSISDDNRRLFLKLIGSTSLSILFMAVIGKGSAKAAFFGSVPGPGTVSIKDSTGTAIDPAILQPTDGFEISEVDDSGTTSYYGFVHKTGAWYITKEDSAGAFRYAKGASDFATGWSDRTTLTYDYFDNVF